MEIAEPNHSRAKRALEEHAELGLHRYEDDEDLTKHKHRANKSRRHGDIDEIDELEIMERNKPESILNTGLEKMRDGRSTSSEIKEIKENNHNDEQGHNLRTQRWQETCAGSKCVENSCNENYDSGNVIAFDYRQESGAKESKNFEFSTKKAFRSDNQVDDIDNLIHVSLDDRSEPIRGDKHRNMGEKFAGSGGHNESHPQRYYSRPYEDKSEKNRQYRDFTDVGHDEGEGQYCSLQLDDESFPLLKDKNIKEFIHRKFQSPGQSRRNSREYDVHDQGGPESDIEKGMGTGGKEREKEILREDITSEGKERSRDDKRRDLEGVKDHWKRNQSRQDAKDGEKEAEHSKELDSQRREIERMDREKLHGRTSYLKDNWSWSWSDGSRSEYTDSIEIMPTKNFDFGWEDSVSTFPGRGLNTVSLTDLSHGDSFQEILQDDDNSVRISSDSQVEKGRNISEASPLAGSGQSISHVLQPPLRSKQGLDSLNRTPQQGSKGGRLARRAGDGRMTGSDTRRNRMPLPILGPPFGPLTVPPGPMQPVGTNMPTPGPPLHPSVFLPPFAGPLLWAARGMDMNMLPLQPSLPPFPHHGHNVPRFPANFSSPGMFFDQLGSELAIPSNVFDPGVNSGGITGRGISHDKTSMSWNPRTSAFSGKSQSRGEQNDYSQNFVDTGMRPQNFIRELEITSVVEDYPKLRELIQRKDEIVAKSSSPPMYYKCDFKGHTLSPDFFGTKFDVILVDPPWEEYAHRAPGVDHIDCWTFEEIQNLKIEAIADTPSFIFLWVGDGVGLEQGRQCLRKWGFRRCEDICWVKTNKKNATSGLRHDSNTLFQHSKEHCLMGIKGTVRRSTDGHIIHANIDTDIIIAEEPPDGSTKKPEDMYRIIEHFALGRRRLELFGEDHNIRPGWLTVGKGLSSSNFNAEAYVRSFADKDGKVWQGCGGRNPPLEAPHLVLTTPEIESLRPLSPPPKNQQPPPQPMPILSGTNSLGPEGQTPGGQWRELKGK